MTCTVMVDITLSNSDHVYNSQQVSSICSPFVNQLGQGLLHVAYLMYAREENQNTSSL